MNYEIKKLIADEDRILAADGEYIATLTMTRKAKALVDDNEWKKGEESWLDYWQRTEQDRNDEDLKRKALAHDIVTAYNIAMGLD